MHLFTKSVGFLAVFGLFPAAFAVTARPSMVTTAGARLPTMASRLPTTTTTTTTSSLLSDIECIDAYTQCIKGADACDSDFSECTNKVLFHAKMPQCISTLAQCSAAGISSLFGTNSVPSLSAVASTNTHGEVTNYTYPTDGSVLGQMITAAEIENRYNTSGCVRAYTNCLKKDTVCGSDFELCTTNAEYKKQRLFCESTLARCQGEGKVALFGSAANADLPSAGSRIAEMIEEGAALAAVNAVSTCYKVADTCILNACGPNPYKCYKDATEGQITTAGDIAKQEAGDTTLTTNNNTSSVAAFIRNECYETISSNKYCYATAHGGKMPSASKLKDEDERDVTYDSIVNGDGTSNGRMNSAMMAKIEDLMTKFDERAKQKCTETLSACVMRNCGGGSGAACYQQVFGRGGDQSINKNSLYDGLKSACASVVNTDTYCKYAAANLNSYGTYSYTYNDAGAFEAIFPQYEDGASNSDPIGVVASLNAKLASTYNAAGIAQLKKNCETVAKSCVKNLCGNKYTKCYRNRTDIYSTLTNTGTAKFDNSMNKVGGVLDYTIVLGLCLDTVKNSTQCEEHLKIAMSDMDDDLKNNAADSWGKSSSVRDGWIDAGGATTLSQPTGTVQAVDDNGEKLCTVGKNGIEQGICNTMDSNGKIFDTPYYIEYSAYAQTAAANTLFRELIYDLEKEAQAIYNSKLTQEQNKCMASNTGGGGIIGASEIGSTYMWAKLRSNKVPSNYPVAGLSSKDFIASNDLYGSFCRVRITIQSDDKRIQDMIKDGASWGTAYFAAGDAITCGSWIPSADLEKIANAVADDATEDMEARQKRTRTWTTVLGGLGGAVGGGFLGNAIQNGDVLGGLTGLGSNSTKGKADSFNRAKNNADRAINIINTKDASKNTKDVINTAKDYADAAIKAAKEIGVMESAITLYTNAKDALEADKENKDFATATESFKGAIEAANDSGDKKSGSGNKSWIGATVGTAVVGTAGTLIANKVTKDIQQSTLDKAQKAAYDEWMNDVGNHITCYIGQDEVGPYGTIFVPVLE